MKELSIIGVVYKEVFGAKLSSEELWNVSFRLLAYRDMETNKIMESLVDIDCVLSSEELRKLRTKVKLDSVYSLTIVVNDSAFKLIDFSENNIRKVEDKELEAMICEYRKSSVYVDKIFGVIRYQKEWGCYLFDYSWSGEQCEISIECDMDQIKRALDGAHALISESNQWLQRAKIFASKELIELANNWYEEDAQSIEDFYVEDYKNLDADDFVENLVLKKGKIDKNGNFSFLFDDGDMFSGYGVYVVGNIKNGFCSAEVAGLSLEPQQLQEQNNLSLVSKDQRRIQLQEIHEQQIRELQQAHENQYRELRQLQEQQIRNKQLVDNQQTDAQQLQEKKPNQQMQEQQYQDQQKVSMNSTTAYRENKIVRDKEISPMEEFSFMTYDFDSNKKSKTKSILPRVLITSVIIFIFLMIYSGSKNQSLGIEQTEQAERVERREQRIQRAKNYSHLISGSGNYNEE